MTRQPPRGAPSAARMANSALRCDPRTSKQVGNVDACNQQHQHHCAQNRKQRGPHALGQVVLQRMHENAVRRAAGAVIAIHVGLRQPMQN